MNCQAFEQLLVLSSTCQRMYSFEAMNVYNNTILPNICRCI
jgi:hypothetical protein